MGPKPQPFSLPEEARRSLTDLLRKGTHSARKIARAHVLLKLDQGLGPTQIHREVGVSAATVINLRRRANEKGWQAALEEYPRSGRPARISGKARAQITALACSEPPAGYAQWSFRLLADRVVELGYVDSISHESVREILKKTNSSRI